MGTLVHTSKSIIRKHEGPHRTALIENFEEPFHYGIHGGILAFYKDKYGKDKSGKEKSGAPAVKEYPATLDHMIAAVGG